MVGALASLSSLQLEVLSARAKAINLLKSKVTTGQFSFNKVVGMAFPSSAVFNPGDEFTMTVFMGAFDSDKQPQVKPDQGTFVEAKDGKATIKLRAPQQGEMKLTGQVGVADKSGDVKWMPYETKIQVGQKAGSISLPDLNVLLQNGIILWFRLPLVLWVSLVCLLQVHLCPEQQKMDKKDLMLKYLFQIKRLHSAYPARMLLENLSVSGHLHIKQKSFPTANVPFRQFQKLVILD